MQNICGRAERTIKVAVGVFIMAMDVAIVGYWVDALLNDVVVWSNLDGTLRGVRFPPTGWFVPWSELVMSNSECRMMEAIPATILATTGVTAAVHVLLAIGAALRINHLCMFKLSVCIVVGTVVTTVGIGIAVVMPIRSCHKSYVSVRYPNAVLLDTPPDMAWVAVFWPAVVVIGLTILFYAKRWLVRRGYIPIEDVPSVVGLDQAAVDMSVL